jgi:hypothetical protein
VIRETVAFFAVDPDRARLLQREILDRPADMRERLATYVQPWLVVVADYIRRGQEFDDVFAEVDPEAYVLQIINLVVSGVATASSLEGGLLPPESLRGTPAERHTRELIRIARYSLFRAPEQRASNRPPHATAGGERLEERQAERGDNR